MSRIRQVMLVCASVAALSVMGQASSAQENNVVAVGINSANISSLDPHRASATVDKGVVSWMFNGLVRFPPGSANPADIEPDLAESWTVSEDRTEWTFKLRQGVPFHGDWGELTAEDVVYSLNRAADPDRSSFASDYSAFESVEAVDDYTVKITLSDPVPGFLGLVANYHGGNIVSKAAAEELGDDFATHPVGTGPFAFEEYVTQQYVELVANEDYFRGAPELDGIMYRFIPSDSSRELAFNSGELDLIYGRREQRWVENHSDDENATVEVFWPAEFRTLHLNKTVEPLDDQKVRQAIAHAINVDQIVQFVGADVGPRGCSVVPSGYLGEDCTSGTYEYDLEKARQLLEEAGYPDGFTVGAVVSSNNAQLPIMEVIQAQLAEAGINMEMQVVDHPTYHELIRQDASAMTFYGAARFPVADSYLTQFYHSDSIVGTPTAVTNFSHCDVADEQIDAARIEPNDERQLELWAEAQKLIHEEICAIPLFNLRQVWLRSNDLDLGYELEGSINLAPPITEETTLAAD